MRINLTLPARINILGSPFDGNEGDFTAISAALEMRAYAARQPTGGLLFAQTDADARRPTAAARGSKDAPIYQLKVTRQGLTVKKED